MEVGEKKLKFRLKVINIALLALNVFNMCMEIWMLGGRFIEWRLPFVYPVLSFFAAVVIGTVTQVVLNCIFSSKLKKRGITGIKLWEYNLYAISTLAFTVIAIIPFIVYGAPIVFMKNG